MQCAMCARCVLAYGTEIARAKLLQYLGLSIGVLCVLDIFQTSREREKNISTRY